MSLENAILEHCKAINNLADAINKLKFPSEIKGLFNHNISENIIKTEMKRDNDISKISDLTDIKVENNDVVLENQSETKQDDKPKRTRKAKNIEQVVNEEIKENADIIDVTNDEAEIIQINVDLLKESALLKIAEGFDRVEIKAMVTKLGFEKISDMNKEAMIKFDSFLKNLKK